MTISFDNPNWWLLCVVPIPILVHLVARTRPAERLFSSIALLRELVRLQSSRTRPKDWLLLLLRTLLCGCLAGVFLLPNLGGGADGEGGRALVLVLDNTASMGAADGQQVRMNRALSMAQAAVQNLAPHDLVNLVTLAGYPRFVFERPESARPLIVRELARTASQPAAAADVSAALQAACSQVDNLPDGVNGLVLLISDFQSDTMKEAVAAIENKASIRCVNVAQTTAVENTALTAMTLTPARPLPGQKVTLTVTLQHWQGAVAREGAQPLSVSVNAGNLRLSQPCELDRGKQKKVQFELTAPSTPGDWVLTAQTEPDAYPEDNTRNLVVPVADKLDCLAIATDRVQLGFMLRALENTPFLRTLYLPSMPETAADFVVWHSPTLADVPSIRARQAAGETVLIVPDFEKDTALLPLLSGKDGCIAGELRNDGGNWKVDFVATDDPSFSLFERAALENLGNAGIYRRLGADLSSAAAGAEVLIQYRKESADSVPVPALLRKPMGRGELLIWNMPVTARDSRQGFSPLYLPLVAEQLLQARGTSDEAEPVAGQDYLQITIPSGVDVAELRLLAADGTECPLVFQGVVARSEQPAVPGVYRWVAGDTELQTVAVNFPREESDLRSFSPNGSVYVQNAHSETQISSFGGRVALWPFLLAAAFIFFVVESLICRKPAEHTKSDLLP
ncbi:MAG: BatA domain-containing protein [Akkermansia sp.]|nr:BatA domain-containing protein [Akkermansia sp.]